MNKTDTDEIRRAFQEAPIPSGLEPNPLQVLRHGHRARRRRRVGQAIGASGLAASIAVVGVSVANTENGPGPATDAQVAAEQGVVVVPTEQALFEIGQGWQMLVDGDALCLGPASGAAPTSGRTCGVDVEFREGSNYGFIGDDPSDPVYVWAVRDTTASAALVSDGDDMLPAQIFEISALGLRIAVVHDHPAPEAGWSLISRNAEGAVTDTVRRDRSTSPPPSHPGEPGEDG